MIFDAEAGLGVSFPQELWTWLPANNGVRMADDDASDKFAGTYSSFLPSGWHLLSVEQIVKVYEWRTGIEATEPSPYPDRECLGWHREWIPFAVETDWLYGRFIDTSTGMQQPDPPIDIHHQVLQTGPPAGIRPHPCEKPGGDRHPAQQPRLHGGPALLFMPSPLLL
ncbi:hypothetical protein ACIHCQ_33180 [Streptomyces sp. NPDC052236]|uniref:hypothetical protein n=1 Tax=Streptomyces sp. NPDC052236 TaxID=3365686 RepID=UPI0037D17E63